MRDNKTGPRISKMISMMKRTRALASERRALDFQHTFRNARALDFQRTFQNAMELATLSGRINSSRTSTQQPSER